MQTARELELLDLRVRRDEPLLARFVRLYEDIFGDPKQRENPKLWPPRLWGVPPEPEPLLHVLIARGADDTLLGGAVCEYYRESSCGLITYLLVAQEARGAGIGAPEEDPDYLEMAACFTESVSVRPLTYAL